MRCGRQKLTRRVWTRGSDGMMNLTFGGSPHGSSALNGIDLEYRESPYATLIVTTFTAVRIASSKSPVMNAATCRTKA